MVKEFFITVQFKRNKGGFGGKDYVYKLISPMYLGKHDKLLILKDPVNEKAIATIPKCLLLASLMIMKRTRSIVS